MLVLVTDNEMMHYRNPDEVAFIPHAPPKKNPQNFLIKPS